MNIRKYFTSRFFIILLILLPAICTDSLLTNELSGTVHFQTIAPFFLQTENDISANKLYANATSTDNITANDEQGGVSLSGTDDNSLYHYELICTTNTLSISENFQFNELINRIRKQGGILDFSFIFMPVFILSALYPVCSEYISLHFSKTTEIVTCYLHRSDGKKKNGLI